MWNNDFTEPLNLQECEERLALILSEMQDIEAQLADRNNISLRRQLLNEDQFNEWRTKAVRALKCKQSQVFQLKLWRKTALKKPQADASPFFPFIGQVINKARLQAIAGQVEQVFLESGCSPGKDYQARNVIEIAAALYSHRGAAQEAK